MGCDGFHPKVPLDLTKESTGKVVEFLEKEEQSGKGPQQAFTTMFFLMPKNVTSERPIAIMPTLIRRWEALRAPEVAKWQQKYRVDWDAADGRSGGAQRTVWEVLMEMERFDGKAKAEDQGAVALVQTCRRPSSESALLWSGPGRRTSASQGRSCGCCVAALSTRGGYSSKAVRQSPCGPSRPSCQGPSLLAFPHCIA